MTRPGVLLALAAALAITNCANRPLPILGEVPQFRLVDQNGKPFDRSALEGKVWIADFIYTTCQGPCPRMSSKLHVIQTQTPASVHLVSFTVDPQNDTPPVLAEYAKHFEADTGRWSFVTGDVATLNALGQDAFHLGAVGNTLEHSTRFVLIDRHGRIRGYYGLSDGDTADRIARDAKRLEKESA